MSWPAPPPVTRAPDGAWSHLVRTVGLAVGAVLSLGGLMGGWLYLVDRLLGR